MNRLHSTARLLIIGSLACLNACAQHSKSKIVNDTHISGHLNRLAKAKSPYLQEHADNPVDWYEWGAEALEKAKSENKPLIISIGYAACHWCHVMEDESFMDSTVAKIMNDNFVSIKIDREERPDIDQVYMNAAQIISGRGGWPLNAFALPDAKPFYAATYFPKKDWIAVLQQISELYKNKPDELLAQANQLTAGIAATEVILDSADVDNSIDREFYKKIYKGWQGMIDYKKGGYSRAPKFPLPVGWQFLLQYSYLTSDPKALEAVNTTLTEMAKGGIYDQIGGGFARYSTDGDWFAPHFEKMLYDNGQLISLYSNAYTLTKNPFYEEVIEQTLAFVKREMTDKNGGFYASLNADSEGEEGKFYVWTAEEFKSVLSPDEYTILSQFYNIEEDGNWENNVNILYQKMSPKALAKKTDTGEADLKRIITQGNEKLLAERAKRVRPSTDDKILVSWNALMMKGYVDAFLALGKSEYLETALENADFIEKNMRSPEGGLFRNYKDGNAGIPAFLDDYALLSEAYISLYGATFDIGWLENARKLADYAVAHFRNDQSGMFYYTSDNAENLIARKMEIADNVIPASNSVMAHVLFQLGVYYFESNYTDMSIEMISQVTKEMETGGPYYANWALLSGFMAYKHFEVAITGENSEALSHQMQRSYLPTTLFMGGTIENLPLLKNKSFDKQTTIFVCTDRVCQLPVQETDVALQMIQNNR